MTRSLIRAFVALGMVMAIPLGCRNIIGVEERVLTDASSASSDCTAYCTLIQEKCTGDNQQYASQTACEKMCATFDPGSADDGNTDSLACRKRVLDNGVDVGEVDCAGAGPTGHLQCGSICDVYCKSLELLCIEQFSTYGGNCLTDCAAFTDCGDYTANDSRDDDSIQCRFFHLNSASVDPETHCPHSIAINHCHDATTAPAACGGS